MEETKSTDNIFLAVRPTQEMYALYAKIAELEGIPEEKIGITERALRYVNEIPEQELEDRLREASTQKIRLPQQQLTVPTSFKVKQDKALVDKAKEKFIRAFKIRRLQQPFFFRVILRAYCLSLLEKDNAKLPACTTKSAVKPLEENDVETRHLFELSVQISKMLLENRPGDYRTIEEIEKIMRRRNSPK